eukprot:snap_masked-scaffold_15-processed-gene-8.40-mRNA-1 protein AED:1.00 eAED:1.00 QI:0/0/0/0/1/1/3/0/846
MFQRSVENVIQSLRNSNINPHEFIDKAISETKKEVSSKDFDIKAKALKKVVYFNLLGKDVFWSIFSIIELLSSSNFYHQRVAVLAATDIIHCDSKEILLLPNLLNSRFQLLSKSYSRTIANYYSVCICLKLTSELSSLQLAPFVFDNVKPFCKLKESMTKLDLLIYNRSTLLLLKFHLSAPEVCSIKFLFKLLSDQLNGYVSMNKKEASSSSQISATVNVITEMCFKRPKQFMKSLSVLLSLLRKIKNNWLLIKLNKIISTVLSSCNSLEVALKEKALASLFSLLQDTSAKSLLYETVKSSIVLFSFCDFNIQGSESRTKLLKACFDNLDALVDSTDLNLSYLGLSSYLDLIKATKMKSTSQIRKEITLKCLRHKEFDLNIKAIRVLSELSKLDDNTKEKIGLMKTLIRFIETEKPSFKLRNEVLLMISQSRLYFTSENAKFFSSFLIVLKNCLHLNNKTANTFFGNQDHQESIILINKKIAMNIEHLYDQVKTSEKTVFKVISPLKSFLNEYRTSLKKFRSQYRNIFLRPHLLAVKELSFTYLYLLSTLHSNADQYLDSSLSELCSLFQFRDLSAEDRNKFLFYLAKINSKLEANLEVPFQLSDIDTNLLKIWKIHFNQTPVLNEPDDAVSDVAVAELFNFENKKIKISNVPEYLLSPAIEKFWTRVEEIRDGKVISSSASTTSPPIDLRVDEKKAEINGRILPEDNNPDVKTDYQAKNGLYYLNEKPKRIETTWTRRKKEIIFASSEEDDATDIDADVFVEERTKIVPPQIENVESSEDEALELELSDKDEKEQHNRKGKREPKATRKKDNSEPKPAKKKKKKKRKNKAKKKTETQNTPDLLSF